MIYSIFQVFINVILFLDFLLYRVEKKVEILLSRGKKVTVKKNDYTYMNVLIVYTFCLIYQIGTKIVNLETQNETFYRRGKNIRKSQV